MASRRLVCHTDPYLEILHVAQDQIKRWHKKGRASAPSPTVKLLRKMQGLGPTFAEPQFGGFFAAKSGVHEGEGVWWCRWYR